MITTNQQWLKISIVIYFVLIIALTIGIIFNFLYANPHETKTCPSINDCPTCVPGVCDDLVVTTCPTANLPMTGLEEPNSNFFFYIVGSVANKPTTDTDIGSFGTVFGSDGELGSDFRLYFRTQTLSSSLSVTWHYSTQHLNFIQALGQMSVNSVAISGTLYSVVMSDAIQASANNVTGVITYVNGTIVLTTTGPISYFLYLADGDSELAGLGLATGSYPVWTTTGVPALANVNYPKYIWSLYQT